MFFVAYAVLLGTCIPDAVSAALSIGTLIVTRPRYTRA